MPSITRDHLRRTSVAACLGVSAAFLTGCGATEETPDVDLDQISEQVQEGIDGARSALQDLDGALADAGLDENVRASVEEATTEASTAIDQARDAVEQQAASAGPEADGAAQEARSALEAARAKVEEAAGQTEGAVKTGLETLGEQIDVLVAELEG